MAKKPGDPVFITRRMAERFLSAAQRVESFRMSGAVRFHKAGRSMHAHVLPGARGGGATAIGSVDSVGSDTLTVTGPDGEQVTIFKPLLLIPTLHPQTPDGSIGFTYDTTQKRTADDGSSTETQVIVPEYQVGSLVEIGPEPRGLRDKLLAKDSGYSFPADLAGMEANSPRFWAKESS